MTSFIDLPSSQLVEDCARGTKSLVSIFDLQMSNDDTRYAPYIMTPTITNPTITSSMSATSVFPGGTTLLTIHSQPAVADAISFVIYQNLQSLGDIVIAGSSDTATTLASALAAAINADVTINSMVSAVPSANTITITNIGLVGLKLASYTGNNGSAVAILGKEWRHLLVSGFAKTRQSREALATALRQSYSALMANYGVFFQDGTSARVLRKGDRYCRDTQYNDLFRYDAFLDVEMDITNTINLYSVLLPKYTKSPI